MYVKKQLLNQRNHLPHLQVLNLSEWLIVRMTTRKNDQNKRAQRLYTAIRMIILSDIFIV